MANTKTSTEKAGTRRGLERVRPRARLIRLIGEELISNQIIALVELIKNAYDADASIVTIRFTPPLVRGGGKITVEDNGHGMSLAVLRDAWMEPATPMKVKQPRSPGGRRVTGEKGIGRFAAARLASKLHLSSTHSQKRVTAVLDWGEFADDKRYLDEVRVKWEERRVRVGTPAGTTLRLEELKDDWEYEHVQRLRGELARLIIRGDQADAFEINLALPEEFGDLDGPITAPSVLGKPHYRLSGTMLATGEWRGEFLMQGSSAEASGTVRIPDTESPAQGEAVASGDEPVLQKGTRAPVCGPFEFDFRVWDRDADAIRDLAAKIGEANRDVRRDLNEACGVSIYRDGFRVLPYGGRDNDWMRLDFRRVQNPTMRLSNNQVVGDVRIGADENPELRDQTNREGLVESVAFEDMRECVKELLHYIESRRFEARREKPRREKQPWIRDLDPEPLRAEFRRRHPEDKEFSHFLDEHVRRTNAGIARVEQTIVRYRRLATLGQLLDVVIHDGRTPLGAIKNDCQLAARELERLATASTDRIREQMRRRFELISNQTEVLLTLFRRLEPFSGRKRGRPVERALEAMIKDVFAVFQRQVDAAGIRLALPESETVVTADPAEMHLLFTNLLDNAIHWLMQVEPGRRALAVQVRRIDLGVEVLFADSGPGVAQEVEDRVFEPYFTTKRDGVGLGLAIAGEIATEYDGSLELVRPGLLPGATFRLVLGKRIGQLDEGDNS